MKCPYCGHSETRVVDSRESEDLNSTRRRRECEKCEKRFTTYERIEDIDLSIVKKDGRREPFDRRKLASGLMKACEKTPVSTNDVEKVVDEIEQELRNMDSTEIQSTVVGSIVMKKLKALDKIAYIRFASVYKSFDDLASFEKELKSLKK